MKITESPDQPKPEIVFPALFKHKEEPTLVVRFFDENWGVVISDPSGINSESQKSCSHWANCITSGHWEPIDSHTIYSARPKPQKPPTFADVKDGQAFSFFDGGTVYVRLSDSEYSFISNKTVSGVISRAGAPVFAIYPEAELKLGKAVKGKSE